MKTCLTSVQPREWIERYVNLTHLTIEPTGGGHFPAQNRPNEWVADVRKFFSSLGGDLVTR